MQAWICERWHLAVRRHFAGRGLWPGRVVEENNLQTHISALRAVLGPDRELIRTVSGRGYQFIGLISPAARDSGSTESERTP